MKRYIIKIIASFVFLVYILTPVMFYQNMSDFVNHHEGNMSDCPYMNESQAVCPMDFSFFLGIWNSTTMVNIKDLKIFIFLLILTISLPFIYKILKIPISDIFYKNQRYHLIEDLYTQLFSKGILNGRAY